MTVVTTFSSKSVGFGRQTYIQLNFLEYCLENHGAPKSLHVCQIDTIILRSLRYVAPSFRFRSCDVYLMLLKYLYFRFSCQQVMDPEHE